jgi:hypothetical protein
MREAGTLINYTLVISVFLEAGRTAWQTALSRSALRNYPPLSEIEHAQANWRASAPRRPYAVITFDANDTITLTGLTRQFVTNHINDFLFV